MLPFLLIYLHNVRGIPLGLAGLAAGVQSAAALLSGFAAGTLADRIGPKRVLVGALGVNTVAFALMPLIRTPWQAFAIYVLWGAGSGSFWPSQSALLAGLATPQLRTGAYALQRLTMNLGIALGGVVAGLIASVAHPATFTVLFLVNCATFVVYAAVVVRGYARSSCTPIAAAAAGSTSRATGRSSRSRCSTPCSWRRRSR